MKEVKSAMKENEACSAPATIKVFARARGDKGVKTTVVCHYTSGGGREGASTRENGKGPLAPLTPPRGLFLYFAYTRLLIRSYFHTCNTFIFHPESLYNEKLL